MLQHFVKLGFESNHSTINAGAGLPSTVLSESGLLQTSPMSHKTPQRCRMVFVTDTVRKDGF